MRKRPTCEPDRYPGSQLLLDPFSHASRELLNSLTPDVSHLLPRLRLSSDTVPVIRCFPLAPMFRLRAPPAHNHEDML
jgi:hypothetical protein